MANIKRANTSGITKTGTAIVDVPDAPTVGTVTVTNATTVSVPFTAATTGGDPTSYTVAATPSVGDISTNAGTSSPRTVTGTFVNQTAYTFTIRGGNSTATGAISASSNSVTPLNTISVDYLVVAGGGGGGRAAGAGGGAGGYRTATAESFDFNTSYTVTVGAGGGGQLHAVNPSGSNGGNSSFGSTTSTGGGGGGGYNNGSATTNEMYVGASGGSGGGTWGNSGAGGAASPAGQGNAGGTAASGAGYGESSGGGGVGDFTSTYRAT
jgi:hypothetical protein